MQQRPDWVMCGTPWPEDGKVAILASTELSQAELEARRDTYRIDPYELFDLYGFRDAPMRYTLTVQMDRFVIVMADTYEQAFRSLFEQWSPQRQARAPLGGTGGAVKGIGS